MIDATELNNWEKILSRAHENVEALTEKNVQETLVKVLRALELGLLRAASPPGTGPNCGVIKMEGDMREWTVHVWVKQAILLAMRWRVSQECGVVSSAANALKSDTSQGRIHNGPLHYFDKFDCRSDLNTVGVRVVPPAVVREGAHVAAGCILMPSYVNIGAYVNAGTMVDTWATVGSCAQIGQNVHLAGGVGIGGVLEPAGARPVLIGDNAFIGSRAIVVEGVCVGNGAVIGANVCLTATTPLYDVTLPEKTEYRGYVPPLAVVAPGTRPKMFPGGEVQLQCAYIIGWRKPSTDAKVSLNEVLRETGISV